MKSVYKITSLIICLSLIFSLFVVTGCKAAEFELSSFAISPAKIVTGGTANVSANITNIGNDKGTYTFNLGIDGIIVETANLTVDIGKGFEVYFPVTENKSGIYTITLNEFSGQLEVAEPASMEVMSLELSETEVFVGDVIEITAELYNPGGFSGNFTCELMLNSRPKQSWNVILDPGETESVNFTYSAMFTGTHSFQMGNLSENITVLKPAFLKTMKAELSSNSFETGESQTLSVSVKNHGDVSGSKSVTLVIDEETIEEKTVTVGAGMTEIITFTVSESAIGDHFAEVDDETVHFLVIPKAPEGYRGYLYDGYFFGRYFIAYPEDWSMAEENEMVIFMSPEMYNGMSPTFNIGQDYVSTELSLMEYFDLSSFAYELLNGYNKVSVNIVTINETRMLRHIYTVNLYDIDVKIVQYMIMDETGMLYVITMAASTSSYSKLQDTFDTIINSFYSFD